MGKRFIMGAIFLLCAFETTTAQMSSEEAMQRLRDREAARAGEVVQSPATQPTQTPMAAKVADLSSQIRTLDVEIIRRFSGTIGLMWTLAQTQDWLDKAASNDANLVPKLINVEANARIIIGAVARNRYEIAGHLFPVGERLALTNADKLDMKPAQTQADAAASALAKLQFQWDSLATLRSQLAKEVDLYQGIQANSSTATISRDRISMGNIDVQLSNLKPQLDIARRANEDANAKLTALEDQHLEGDKIRLQAWGPVILRTSDESLLTQRPGAICTARVKVTAVAVRVVRIPDGAGWDFTSQESGAGQTHLPSAPDDHGRGAIPPEVATVIWTACDDTASAPPASAPVTLLPPIEATPPSPGTNSNLRPEPPGSAWSGTGFFITADGLILTNRHVAQGARTLMVVHGGQQSAAEVLVLDDSFDLAVIRIKPASKVPFVTLSPLDVPNEGAECTVLGFPLTSIVGTDIKITRGVVSSNSSDMGNGADVMTDAKVNHGNSGGPILDKYGNVMAVICLKTLAAADQESYGFGIGAGHVRLFLEKNQILLPAADENSPVLSTEDIVKKAKPATVFILGAN
jgi:hypothetical protein